jgi:hypothetical protein
MSESYFNYKITEFLVEPLGGGEPFDLTSCISSIQYFEDLFSPSIFITMTIVDSSGILNSLPNKEQGREGIRGGERVSLVIEHPATKETITLDETKNTYYIYKVYGSTTQSTKEVFTIDLCPAEVFMNETSRVIGKYKTTIGQTAYDILKKVLYENKDNANLKKENIEDTANNYVFYGNIKRPFTVLTWLCPKAIPKNSLSKSTPEKGTAGFLFYQNKNGFNFRSVDSLFSGFKLNTTNKVGIATYFYTEQAPSPASIDSNFRISSMPVFEKNVNIMENLRIGMYSSKNYFFDINARKFDTYNYTLKESYPLMSHASKSNTPPQIPLGLDSKDHPSRLMVRILDNFSADPANDPPNPPAAPNGSKDNTLYYQAQSVARYNLAFSQSLNITVPLNLKLTVGNLVELNFGYITKEAGKKGTKDKQKSGYYLIKELSHLFEQGQHKGWTALKLIKDSYGEPPE